MPLNYLICDVVDFSHVVRDTETVETESSYDRVLREVTGEARASGKIKMLDITTLPLFKSVFDLDDIHSVSPVIRNDDKNNNYCQVLFKDGNVNYIHLPFGRLVEVLCSIGTVYE